MFHHGVISQELLKLSYNDRNAIAEEIHGVRCLAIQETPELLRKSLDAFQFQLDSMLPPQKEVYSKIIRLRNLKTAATPSVLLPRSMSNATQSRDLPAPDGPLYSFVDDVDFRLRFLRCELFNVQKAVVRFMNYLNTSYELFGDIALTRMVRISDLTKSEVRLLRRGHLQILPYRDRAGRCVLVLIGKMSNDIDCLERTKILFFMGDSVTRDSIESQQKGIVFVGDVTTKMDREVHLTSQNYSFIKQVINAIPSRVVAMHSCWPHCFTTSVLNVVDNFRKFIIGTEFAARMRIEVGTEMETRYKLRGYGIPIHLLPMTKSGAVKVKYLNDWIRIRKILEESSEEEFAADDNALARVVILPCLTDVVFRQGTPSMKNPGNVTFRDIMMNHLVDYYNQHNYIKGHQPQPEQIETFCIWLIETIEKTKGGRFLEWDKNLNVWVKIIDRQKIKSKVTIAFRDASKRYLDRLQKVTAHQAGVNRDSNPSTNAGGSYAGGSYIFIEGGKDGTDFCETRNRNTRSDSNYNETSC